MQMLNWLKRRTAKINERHRHRYEFNNEYRQKLEEAGLVIAGTTPDGKLVKSWELKDHPYFVAANSTPIPIPPPFTSPVVWWVYEGGYKK